MTSITLFTDIDSLTYEMFMMNFSSTNIFLTLATFQKIPFFFDETNKSVIGKMKEEL